MRELEEVAEAVRSGKRVLLDVREADEPIEKRLECALLWPITKMEDGEWPDLPIDQPLYVHCRRGHRVVYATHLLREHFSDVVPLLVPIGRLEEHLN